MVLAVGAGVDEVVLGEGAEGLGDRSLEAGIGSGDAVDWSSGAGEGIGELRAEAEVLLREVIEVEQIGAEVNATLAEITEGKDQVGL